MSTVRNLPVGADLIVAHHANSYDYISPLKLDLTGQHILMTGVADTGRVGYDTATAFALAGASRIACCDLHDISDDMIGELKSAAKLANREEPLVLVDKVDISSQESVKAMYDSIAQEFKGRLDVLVNNAAHMEPYKPFLESGPDIYWRTWEVNIRGLFNMARAFLPIQLSRYSKFGSSCTIINVSSSGALSVRPGSGSYRISKLAVLRWTESLQVEYGKQGLLALCVNPGAIKTKITEGAPEAVRNALPHRPDIAGDTIAWLASERRDWLGGRYVSCPWDMEELLAKKDEIINEDKLKLRMVV
ncbi:NADP(+)-dependent dehydrogenase [Fusarium tjaetaba]|uniref:NADP(+)-dependent dehydrogenase n=1 Tax=Fusarium tjaetaba TaxID=1567544 RepID=A0A8H5W2Q1_9HYPO|nr:NADP(+)-dependent dehydrogenase [Fusarium tjaetaba]KAF5643355.1 NADP(+)-dependent dehydrogenase [Fusarium tjaetaba]